MCGFLTCFLFVLKKRKIFNILQNAHPIKKLLSARILSF